MRSWRRLSNPIFLEDEGHNWKSQRSGARKLLITVLLLAAAVGLALLIIG